MSTLLTEQFDAAVTRIEVSAERAKKIQEAHAEVRGHLESSKKLVAWGVDTVLIGSYGRGTAIHPGRDVDVFAKMTLLDTGAYPDEVFNEVVQVLQEKYGDRVTPGNRAIKVAFGEDFIVEIVPAVRSGSRWAIPVKERELWRATVSASRWLETDPEKLTGLTEEMNKTVTVNGRGAYVPTVKLVRQTRRHHLGREGQPPGFYFELMTYWAFQGQTRTSFAEIFSSTLSSIADQLEKTGSQPVINPSMNEPYSPVPNAQDLASAAARFRDLSGKAEKALGLDKCPAAVVWREILGENERGIVFPLPPGCDETGKAIESVTATKARGSREARGYGSDRHH